MPAHPLGPWPYEREQPDVIVLRPQAGVQPSALPPVRVFLGTEEGQYRAERVFVWSVMRHRDPARAYEIHLMKNLKGFNRRGWRTGFTCYRFAIPSLAGDRGRAIYSDVDQVYLADPAELFDLPLEGHGYLAIDARDTSVMLIDCERMLPWWNRDAASKGKKGPLTNVPAGVPGLWGKLDHHWNARDLEYVEGRTMCLHYTALHQQPWNPFPEQYSYHANPLAYLWHDLERDADAAGFQPFTPDEPSPAFTALVGSNERPVEAAPALKPSKAAAKLLNGSETLVVGLGEPALATGGRKVDIGRERRLGGGAAEVVVASGLFERLPPADAGWVLDQLFAAARRAVYVQLKAQAADGVGSPDWWRRRVELAAARRPEVSWLLDAATPSGAVRTSGIDHVELPTRPAVWVLTESGQPADRRAVRLAESLGWPFTTKRIAYSKAAGLPNLIRGASLIGVDKRDTDPIDGEAPDLVIIPDPRAVPVARWIRKRSDGITRLVQLGRPAVPFELFDLIVALPEERLPIRSNVVQLSAPLDEGLPWKRPLEPFEKRLEALPQPRAMLMIGDAEKPYRLGVAEVGELILAARREVGDGSLLVWLDPALPDEVADAARAVLTERAWVEQRPRDPEGYYGAFKALADGFVVHAGDPESLADIVTLGRPIALHEAERGKGGSPLMRLVLPLIGGSTYRGTPLQQHFPGRIYDWLITRGILHRRRDPTALHRALEARGRLRRIGAAEPVASPKPLDELGGLATRVRRLLTERPQTA